jgi:hypothetical protein
MRSGPPRSALFLAFLLPATSCAERLILCPGEAGAGEPCESDVVCGEELVCFEGTCVGEGLLRVSLAWESVTDLDLHVVTPGGSEIYWDQPDHPTGMLDVDDCVVRCRDSTGVHVENVFFNADAQRGEYAVWVTNFNGRRAADFFVEVSGEGVSERWEGSLDSRSGAQSQVWTFVFNPDGAGAP